MAKLGFNVFCEEKDTFNKYLRYPWVEDILGEDFFVQIHTIHYGIGIKIDRSILNESIIQTNRLSNEISFTLISNYLDQVSIELLANLKNANYLELTGNDLLGINLISLSKIRNLNTLVLYNCNLNDSSITYLKSLRIDRLILGRNKISKQGMEELKKLLKNCIVE